MNGLLAAGLLAALLHATPAPRPCADRDDLVGPCRTVRGRLMLYNGSPTYRIWRVGTGRIVGLRGARDDGADILPPEVEALAAWDARIFGDFRLCPLTRLRAGVMQMACLDRAANLRIERD